MLTLRGKYYDGQYARAYDVTIAARQDGLHMQSMDAGLQIFWPLDEVQIIERPHPPLPGKLGRITEPESRLFLDSETNWHDLQNYLPAESSGGFHVSVSWPSIALYSLAAIAFAAIIFAGAPKALEYGAYAIPPDWEDQIGDYAVRSIVESPVCVHEHGEAALTALTEKLHEGATKAGYNRAVRYRVRVVQDDETLNALAAPGGHIVLFSGALITAEEPDEIAGILAHEMAHIALRHPMRGIMRDVGFNVAMQLMFGTQNPASTALQIAGVLNQMKYSRDKESEADNVGYDILLQAGINPKSLVLFLDRLPKIEMGETTKPLFDYIATHPDTPSRMTAIERRGNAEGQKFARALTRRQWQDLKNICAETRSIE